MSKSILDFVLDPDYRLDTSHAVWDQQGERKLLHGIFPYYELPSALGYPTEHEVYIEYDELRPSAFQVYTLVYTIHDTTVKVSTEYLVSGIYDEEKDIFVVATIAAEE